jgi:hypothetical protein
VLLHQRQELDDDLGRRTDQDLALATLLSVVDVVEAVVQDGDADHFDMLLVVAKTIKNEWKGDGAESISIN